MGKQDNKGKHTHSGFGSNISEFVFGLEDGLIGALGLVAGLTGAVGSPFLIILAGFTEVFAQIISMSSGAFLSIKTQNEYYQSQLHEEEKHLYENLPDIKRSLRGYYSEQGYKGTKLSSVVNLLCSERKACTKLMLQQEVGIRRDSNSPVKGAIIMGFSVLVGGTIPILPFFVFPAQIALLWAVGLTLAALFSFGAFTSHVSKRSWLRGGLEMLAVGVVASVGAYFVGSFVASIFGVSAPL